MIDVYDDVLEEHNAILIDDEVKKLSWKYDYPSEPSKPNKHWHVLCGHNKEECDAASYDWADTLFNLFVNKFDFKSKYDVEDYERIYCNAHTHGIEPHLHIDDGDFTMIYYPRIDWKPEWGGGTLVDDTLVSYAGNKLVVFTASLPHMAMPVSRECYQLRTCVVFKCNVVDGIKKTIEFYKENLEKGNYQIRFE
jgi:hypothetical protein